MLVDIYEDEVSWYDALGICSDSGMQLEYRDVFEAYREVMARQYLHDNNR